ncbi:MAG: response regulator [Deltaproteobacteria bacterium]|nr:response regulator [Deltaproteobacteria bacterium]
MNVLIAEDNERLQQSVGLLMKLWGFDFDLVSNGQEAVEKAITNKNKYDLCLMDIEMPVMDGCKAARRIRREGREFPIIAISGSLNIQELYLDAGMDDYLEKPYDPQILLNKIMKLTV